MSNLEKKQQRGIARFTGGNVTDLRLKTLPKQYTK